LEGASDPNSLLSIKKKQVSLSTRGYRHYFGTVEIQVVLLFWQIYFAIFVSRCSCLSFDTDVGHGVTDIYYHMEDDFTGSACSTCGIGETCVKTDTLKT
jgi:hypothetical protein